MSLLKTYTEDWTWCNIYLPGLKDSFLVYPETAFEWILGCTSCSAIMGAINERLANFYKEPN